jgi:hypothetical protein
MSNYNCSSVQFSLKLAQKYLTKYYNKKQKNKKHNLCINLLYGNN